MEQEQIDKQDEWYPEGFDKENFRSVRDKLKWTFAKTYENTTPHEYVIRGKTIDHIKFNFMARMIRQYGTDKPFFSKTFIRYYDDDQGYTYWIYEKEGILNRAPLENQKRYI